MSKKLITVVALVLIVAALATVLVACVPGSIAKARTKMEKAGYNVIDYEYNQADKDKVEGGFLAGALVLPKLVAVRFTSTSYAKEAYQKIKASNPDSVVKQSGKWVYYGTAAAVKAFEK